MIPARAARPNAPGFGAAPRWRAVIGIAAAAAVLAATAARTTAWAAGDTAIGPASGLPVPRFVSLKPDRVTVRGCPTRDHEIAFVFTRAGLPVEITAESDNWRRIRDWEGSEGWVLHSLLSGRRTALILAPARAVDDFVALHASADGASAVTARLQAGVLAGVKRCSDSWCRISGEGFDGWIEEDRLWGVYPGEKVD